jgi:hypothetical protein
VGKDVQDRAIGTDSNLYMARANEPNLAARSPTLAVPGMEGKETVDELLNGSFSPLSYRDRATKHFPARQEPDALDHYFVGVQPRRSNELIKLIQYQGWPNRQYTSQ